MKKTPGKLFLTLSWLIFPPVYIYLIFKNKTLEKRIKRWAYISLIISPFTICIISLIVFQIVSQQPDKVQLGTLEESLQIRITGDIEVEKNTTTYTGQDYNENIILKLSDRSLKKIINQIEKSPFFNIKNNFYGNDESEWRKSDTLLYWKVRNYLESEHLTGYWIKDDDFTYSFYSPNLSDIPNSALLFNEGFDISANLSIKDKTLRYEYIKY